MYKVITDSDITFFQQIVGVDYVLHQSHERFAEYSKDHTEDLVFNPDIVLLPKDTSEISRILSFCNEQKIVVTPRGAGTGLSGGSLPVYGGVVLSLERLNAIIDIDQENFQVVVESGVINEVLQQALDHVGLFYPPDPASKGSCFLGGNVAHSSGGPKALKYGTTRDYVLNLEVVLPNGEIFWTGANTLKYSTGYNLTHLMIGSEGTLAVVSKIVLKVISKPKHTILVLASFESATSACKAVSQIFSEGFSPSICEFVESEAFALSAAFTGLSFQQDEKSKAYLLIEFDGNYPSLLEEQVSELYKYIIPMGCIDMLLADTSEKKEFFWKLRRSIGEATKYNNVYKEEDTVVPRATLSILYDAVKEIGARYGFRSICYGHAGDGNLHVNILKDQLSDSFWNQEIKQAIKEIFLVAKKLHGTISGEHGIGYVQKEFMPLVLNSVQLDLMKSIKKVFDPNNILNPGKIV
ncbi:MAG: FAD-linked oxidase C-terminal domain-containing protein [Chitinophagaceae bacterium]